MSKQICLKKTTNKEGRLEFDFFDSNIGRSNFMKKKYMNGNMEKTIV